MLEEILSPYYQENLAVRFSQQASGLTRLRTLDERPADFLLEYLRQFARRHFGQITNILKLKEDEVDSWSYRRIRLVSNRMILSRDSLQRWLALPTVAQRASVEKFNVLLQDYANLIQTSQNVLETTQITLQQRANQAAIDEARRALVQSESIGRLTLVAFVFIPLNFATAFFGMNLRQLGTGSTSAGYFFLGALVAFGAAGLLGWGVKLADRVHSQHWKDFHKSQGMPGRDINRENPEAVSAWQAFKGFWWKRFGSGHGKRRKKARAGSASASSKSRSRATKLELFRQSLAPSSQASYVSND